MNEGNRIGSILLAFAIGAAAGAAAAYLAVPEHRQKVRELARSTSSRAGSMPKALRDASSAARKAFNETYQEETGSEIP